MEPASTTVGASTALIKYFGAQILIGVGATSLAFLVMPPKSKGEFFGRMICTLLASYIFGPVLVAVVHSWYPAIFDSAQAVAALNGQDPAFGVLYVSTPLQVVAGIPAWWVIGALVRWFDKRRDADLGELVNEARSMAAAHVAPPAPATPPKGADDGLPRP
jgi:hypothetical protein